MYFKYAQATSGFQVKSKLPQHAEQWQEALGKNIQVQKDVAIAMSEWMNVNVFGKTWSLQKAFLGMPKNSILEVFRFFCGTIDNISWFARWLRNREKKTSLQVDAKKWNSTYWILLFQSCVSRVQCLSKVRARFLSIQLAEKLTNGQSWRLYVSSFSTFNSFKIDFHWMWPSNFNLYNCSQKPMNVIHQ